MSASSLCSTKRLFLCGGDKVGKSDTIRCKSVNGAQRRVGREFSVKCSSEAPLLVKAARGEKVPRPPAWMMRQAGRYMKAYRNLAEKHPDFRERSEVTDLIVAISLQPWEAFKPDGVIIFSDILTPLSAIGVPFEIDDDKGPIIAHPVKEEADVSLLHSIDLSKLQFVAESLTLLRKEVGDGAAVLGFVGSPWTLATYCVEGKTSRIYKEIKTMALKAPHVLDALLTRLATEIAEYSIFQIEAGAQCIQIFDSWGGQLPPHLWDVWSKPYIQLIVNTVKAKHPEAPLVLYANGSGGILERMGQTGVDVIGLDWTLDMGDSRARLGANMAVQGNVDPVVLFSSPEHIEDEINRVVSLAGERGHILNLGHGVLVGTPEDSVAHFFNYSKNISFS